MIYIDTCVLKLLVDEKDSLRKDKNFRKRAPELLLRKNAVPLCVPMPAFGEAVCKIKDKCGDRGRDVFLELDRIMDNGTVVPRYLSDARAVFGLAKELSEDSQDDRDLISPMDAFIVAAAAADPECNLLVTSDTSLILDARLADAVASFREDRDFDTLQIKKYPAIFRST